MIVPCIRLDQYEYPTIHFPEHRCCSGTYSTELGVGPNPIEGSFKFTAEKSGVYQFGPYMWFLNLGDSIEFDRGTNQAFYNNLHIGEWCV